MNPYMQLAVEAAREGMKKNLGGPFGAVIVRNGEVIAVGHNEVLGTNDPTAHAEIVAIRRATAKLGRFDISDCEIYSTCEPCPMCLAAIHWAGITKLYFGADRHDATIGGFDDEFIYQIMKGTVRSPRTPPEQGDCDVDSPLLRPEIVDAEACRDLFRVWNRKEDRTMY